jgi:hypothetical protein
MVDFCKLAKIKFVTNASGSRKGVLYKVKTKGRRLRTIATSEEGKIFS